MALDEQKRDWLRRMDALSKETALESGWGTPAGRAGTREWLNARRQERGIPPLTRDDDYPSELEFHERARVLGLLRRGRSGS